MSRLHNEDVKKFEATLKAEKEKIKKNIEIIKAELNSIGIEDEIDDTLDLAELEIDNTTDQALLHQLETEIAEIDAALGRIQAGTYGVCEKTGKHIPAERLMANPSARTIVDA